MSNTEDSYDSLPGGQGIGDDKASWRRAKGEASADARDRQLELLRQAGTVLLGAVVLLTPQMLAFLVVVGGAVYMCIAIRRFFTRRLGQAIR